MAQKFWKISDPIHHSHYDIGMYHGNESNHLIIYINEKPIIVDFNIDFTTQYSFMIGPNLYNLKVTKLNLSDFKYQLELDELYKQKLDEKRKIEGQWDQLKLMTISAVILIVLYFLRK